MPPRVQSLCILPGPGERAQVSVCLFKLSIIYSPKVSLLSTNRTHGSQEGVRQFCANNSNLFCHGITGIVYFAVFLLPGCNWIPEISLPSLTVLSVLEGCTTSGAVSNAGRPGSGSRKPVKIRRNSFVVFQTLLISTAQAVCEYRFWKRLRSFCCASE